MILSWHWPWAALAAALAALAAIALVAGPSLRRRAKGEAARAFSLDDDLNTPEASRLFRQWRWLGRLAAVALALALALAVALVARPSTVDRGQERSASRDIVLCLDVSGSTLPYDREVIDTYLDLVKRFEGERIGMSIFNSTSRTVFPLTDDYDLVTRQLEEASRVLKGVTSQDSIDRMSERDYQRISDWLDGTQNRKDETSLIGDGVVSCAAMLPGFAYGTAQAGSDGQDGQKDSARHRAASIVLATDNVVSGNPTYTLDAALDLTRQAGITVDGLYSGPASAESDARTKAMRTGIESHGGVFLPRSGGEDVESLVRRIDTRRQAEERRDDQAALVDAPGWWTLALVAMVAVWLTAVWRLRR
ncbi:VWA domain-containing protein [Bifidobacterium pullorum subsp. saeculare]|uniref:VWA domain-containing protein n=1 Tax=Bifidobacterium pullorum subsp. saeculare TaxID=78257 RepID=A0A939B8Y2_9BIFI|nr:VWA domain-containing protein [Bifidobacterium pullorum]MBM6698854.1 VWA domain-containing protein [Bifidobacterium pullorum subsp. saeculare]